MPGDEPLDVLIQVPFAAGHVKEGVFFLTVRFSSRQTEQLIVLHHVLEGLAGYHIPGEHNVEFFQHLATV